MQLKSLSNIPQYFAVSAVSDCPYSLRATLIDVLKIYAAWRTFITENGVKFICSVVILGYNCNPRSKSSNIKFLMWLQVR